MPDLSKTVCNPKDVSAPEWFSDAVAAISASKSWARWSRPVTRTVYENLCLEVAEAIRAMGMGQKETDYFVRDTLDYYIDHGTLKPAYGQYVWELGLFHAFKSRIDSAILRRARAVSAAAARKARKEADAKNVSAADVNPQADTVVSVNDNPERKCAEAVTPESESPETATPGSERRKFVGSSGEDIGRATAER